MKKTIAVGLLVVGGWCALAADDACANGACEFPGTVRRKGTPVAVAEKKPPRVFEGYADAPRFLAFLNAGEKDDEAGGRGHPPLPDQQPAIDGGFWAACGFVVLVFVGGFLLNLTPCVLPLVPVNAIVIGRGFGRGLRYGAGVTCAYGGLGLAAAFGGMKFGTLQGAWWFNLGVAVVFLILSLSLAGVFHLDFSKWRPTRQCGLFLMGALSALLAGACVAPVVITTLGVTARECAAGRYWAAALPFVLGLGMASPWPLLAAGWAKLPKPGAWMKEVNRFFAFAILLLAAYYGYLAYLAWDHGGLGKPVEATASASTHPARLVEISAPWCRYCTLMEKTTLQDPAVKKVIERIGLRKIMINDFDDLARYPELKDVTIHGVPAFVLFE